MINNWRAAYLWSICCILLVGTNLRANPFAPVNDSIPLIERQIYRGYRIHVTEIKVQQKKGEQIKIKYTAINTGREKVSLGNTASIPEHLIILFDGSLQEHNLNAFADQIRQELARTDLRLEPGFIRRDLSLSFSTKGTTKSTQADYAVKGNPSSTPRNETQISEPAPVTIPQPEDPVPKAEQDMDINACADLSIQTVKIKSKNKKNITLQITLINQGAGPARIYRDKERKQPQVAIRGNFSSTENLSRGDIVIGGDYLESKNKEPHGWLKPQETLTTTVKFDMRKKSRFTPFIILELDAYNGLAECDETNNLSVISLEEK